jgi:hypothetical protein
MRRDFAAHEFIDIDAVDDRPQSQSGEQRRLEIDLDDESRSVATPAAQTDEGWRRSRLLMTQT